MRRIKLASLIIIAAFAVLAGSENTQADAAPEAPLKSKSGTEITKTKSNIVSTTSEAKIPSYNAKALHRLDFRVVGKSCAVCLLGIQKRVSTVPGSIKAAVQLQAPYAAVILYDSSKTNQKALIKKAQETIPEVTFEAIEDKPIDKLPAVLVPKIGDTILTN
jgi:copper chaperone CopZ